MKHLKAYAKAIAAALIAGIGVYASGGDWKAALAVAAVSLGGVWGIKNTPVA